MISHICYHSYRNGDSFQCNDNTRFDYVDNLIAATLLPISLSILIFLTYHIHVFFRRHPITMADIVNYISKSNSSSNSSSRSSPPPSSLPPSPPPSSLWARCEAWACFPCHWMLRGTVNRMESAYEKWVKAVQKQNELEMGHVVSSSHTNQTYIIPPPPESVDGGGGDVVVLENNHNNNNTNDNDSSKNIQRDVETLPTTIPPSIPPSNPSFDERALVKIYVFFFTFLTYVSLPSTCTVIFNAFTCLDVNPDLGKRANSTAHYILCIIYYVLYISSILLVCYCY